MVDGDNFFHMLDGKFCSEAWDCISRYVYTALQGGSIMRGWTNDEKMMITCCNDGTRPVIFKLERIDEEEASSFRITGNQTCLLRLRSIQDENDAFADMMFHCSSFITSRSVFAGMGTTRIRGLTE